MRQGIIIRIFTNKKFGFIKTDNGEYFFHMSAVEPGVHFDSLRIGQKVNFVEEESAPRGLRAKFVSISKE